jgi:predicted membrane protein
MAESNKPDSRFLVGFIFVIIGAYLLLVNLNLLPFELPDYLLSWKTLLIALGLLIVATRENKGGGITLIAVGGVFLVTDILDVTLGELIREVWLFWPVVFIIIGLTLILRRSREKKRENEDGFRPHESADDYTEVTAIVGGNNKIIYSQSFRGAKMTAILGGADINLVNARLAPGRHEIDVFALFGGCTLIVPNDWNVKLDVTPIVGGFEDKRSFPQSYLPNADTELVIRGVVIFGGGELKSS